MKKIVKPLLIIVAVAAISTACICNSCIVSTEEITTLATSLKPHNSISINGNSEFTTENGVTSGSGTARPGLEVNVSRTTVALGDEFWIRGTAPGTDHINILVVSPNGSNGTVIDIGRVEALPSIYHRISSVSTIDYTFERKVHVDDDSDTGKYLVEVLSPGLDTVYNGFPDSVGVGDFIDALVDKYGLDEEAKTQDQLAAIINNTTINAPGSDDFLWTGYVKCEKTYFDTGTPPNPYPSISGTHKGVIIPNQTIAVSKLYTYPCPGTGGHSEYVKIYGHGVDEGGLWNGYRGDWHNITFDAPFTLESGKTYNYTITTSSYPQIIHKREFNANGGKITCSEFIDVNGKSYNDWIPAIRLE